VSAPNDQETLWFFQSGVLARPLEVDWKTEGDNWLYQLRTAMDRFIPGAGLSMTWRQPTDTIPVPQLLFTVQEALPTRLVVVPTVGGLLVAIESDGPPFALFVDPWVAAVTTATEAIAQSHVEIPWTAVVGQCPGHFQTEPQLAI
jgi:hypothetical protein